MTREEAIHILIDLINPDDDSEEAVQMVIKALEQEPKTGHWIKNEDDTCWWYVCSECGQVPLKNIWNDADVLSQFCPNCGAKMVELQES